MALSPTESLATVAEADAFAVKMNWPEADWANLDPEPKEAALREATLYINSEWAWSGRRVSAYDTPTSAWPYTLVFVNGQWLDFMPPDVKAAAILLARLATKAPLLGGEDAGKRTYRRVKVGQIEREADDQTASELREQRLAFANSLLRSSGGRSNGNGYSVALRRTY